MFIFFIIQVILFAIFGIAVASFVTILVVEKTKKSSSVVSDEVDYLNWLGIN